MRKTGKKNLKIAGATVIALFSLTTVFTATFAWFALSKNVNSSGATIEADPASGRLNKIEIYVPNDLEHPVVDNTYVFKNTPSSTIFGNGNSNNIYLGEFESLSIDHPILILFTLRHDFTSAVDGDIYVKGITEVDDFLGSTDSSGNPLYELGPDSYMCRGQKNIGTTSDPVLVDCYPLSSVINFKCAHFSSAQYNNLTNGKSTIDIPTNLVTLRESFVNFENGATVRFENEPKIFESEEGDVINRIAMIVNYDDAAVTAIYSTYLGEDIISDGPLYFTCDFGLEVF